MKNLFNSIVFVLLQAMAVSGFADSTSPGRYDDLQFDRELEYRLTTFQSPLVPKGELWPRLLVPVDAGGASYRDTTIMGTDTQVWLSPSHSVSGTHSLGISIFPNRFPPAGSADNRDKAVLHVFKHSDPKMRLDMGRQMRRYVGLEMKFAKNYQLPDPNDPGSFVLHFQAWQQSSLPPPFNFYIQPGEKLGEIELVFVIRNDDTRKGIFQAGEEKFRGAKVIHRLKLVRDRWYNMIFQLEPSHNADGRIGQVAFWLDGTRQFVYRGDWGYAPSEMPLVTNYIGVNIGVYRYKQARLQTVFFDDVRTGASWQSVVDPNDLP